MNSISCRKQVRLPAEKNPFEIPHYDVEVDPTTGEKKFVESPVVPSSLASDYDVVNNAIYRGMMHGVTYRLNTDPVDFPEKVFNLLNNE